MSRKPISTDSLMTRRVLATKSGQCDWFTPERYVTAVREVFGDVIDLDPASCKAAQRIVQARRFYAPPQDGVLLKWFGNAFCNPPYDCVTIRRFVTRMCTAWQSGEIDAGILLTNCSGDTSWFHEALNSCTAFCITRGRISFTEVRDGNIATRATPTMGSVFWYFGNDTERFATVFAQFGAVIVRHPHTLKEAA
jgi:ParB family chromosome partitioning protein